MRGGCPVHQTCQGSGFGAKYRAVQYYITAAHLRSSARTGGLFTSSVSWLMESPWSVSVPHIVDVYSGYLPSPHYPACREMPVRGPLPLS